MAQNILNNNALEAFQVPRNVYNAIKKASATTGVNFTYLVEKAAVESSFDTNAKAKTSSATGLFQFIESTWMNMVKKHGDKYGLEKYADKIDDNGRVADSKTRKEILNLRKDPEISSLMAAEFAASNNEYLQQHVGGKIGATELYMAHFLGAGGASGFLNAMKKSPNMAAADLFPEAARTNRNVFYDQKTGAPRTMREVYAFFDKKFDGSSNSAPIMTAQAPDLRINNSTAQTAAQQSLTVDEDPLARLAALMGPAGTMNSPASMLRIPDASSTPSAVRDWQIFPPSLYSNLSLSPAQMMMLSDFSA